MRNKQPAMMKVTLDDILATRPAPGDGGWTTIDDLADGSGVHRETVRRRLVEAVKRGEMEARMFTRPCGLSGLRRGAMHFRRVAQ